MKEKRKLERRNFIYDIEVLDRTKTDEETGDFVPIGDLADVTVEGIMLVTDDPVEENADFQMRLVLPEKIDGLTHIDFEAHSIRCNKTIHETIFTTGFLITKLDHETRQTMTHLIDELAV